MPRSSTATNLTTASTLVICGWATQATIAMMALVAFRGQRGGTEALIGTSLWFSSPYIVMACAAMYWRPRVAAAGVILVGSLVLSAAGLLLVYYAFREFMDPPIRGRRVMSCGPPLEFLIPIAQVIGVGVLQVQTLADAWIQGRKSTPAHVPLNRDAHKSLGRADDAQDHRIRLRK